MKPGVARVMSSCPECGRRGKAVERRTPEHLLTEAARVRMPSERDWYFCATADCPVVYFTSDGATVFHKADVRVRVTQKETADPVPVCYCYGHFRADVAREIRDTGRTTIPDRIKVGVKAGSCDCEEKNPQGSCCLGNVAAAVRWARSELAGIPVGAAGKEERS